MRTLLERLRNHDWFYGYADDHRAWKRGRASMLSLKSELASLDCQYDMGDIRRAVTGMIREDFAPDDTGYWYRQPRKYKNVAGVKEEDLIDRSRAQEIVSWLDECSREQVSRDNVVRITRASTWNVYYARSGFIMNRDFDYLMCGMLFVSISTLMIVWFRNI